MSIRPLSYGGGSGGSIEVADHRGAYADRTAYDVGDVVLYNNELYYVVSVVANTNTTKPDASASFDTIDVTPRTDSEINTLASSRARSRYTDSEKSKLSGIASSAEANVQADWNETDTSSDAHILNKPTIPDNNAIDARIADWAEEGNTDTIPAEKLVNAPVSTGSGLSQLQVDARVKAGVADWAEEGNTDAIPSAKLTNASGSGLNQNEVDARIATYARATPSGTIADAQIPSTITRDTELATKADLAGSASQTFSVDTPTSDSHAATKKYVDDNAPPAAIHKGAYADGTAYVIGDVVTHNNGLYYVITAVPETNTDDPDANTAFERLDVESRTDTEINALIDAKYTAAEKSKLAGIAAGAEVNVNADWDASTGDAQILNKPSIPGNTEIDARVTAGVSDWAEEGNSDLIPAAKLANASGGSVAGTPPREITGSSNVYALSDSENEIFVELTYSSRVFTTTLLRAELSSTAKAVVFDSRNPQSGITNSEAVGFNVSISGNNVTINAADFLGSITAVYGLVSGARGPQGNPGTTDYNELANKPSIPGNTEIDARIATYARATPSGTIADAQIPSTITRDTELATKADLAGSSSQTFSVAAPTADAHAATKKYVDDNAPPAAIHKGAYADNTEYVVGDVVTYNSGLYYVISAVASDNTDKPDASSKFERLDVESRTDTEINALIDAKYTAAEKSKLAGVATGAEVNVNADWNASTGDAQILNKPSIPGNTEIDARVTAGVSDWAEEGNSDLIPLWKQETQLVPGRAAQASSVVSQIKAMTWVGDRMLGIHSTGNYLIRINLITGETTRIGTATDFGNIGTRSVFGLVWDGTNLYTCGTSGTTEALFTIDTTSGEATQVGSATKFGVNESFPRGLAWDGSNLYMVGQLGDTLYTVDRTTGVATRVGSATEFGVAEQRPDGLTWDGYDLYMTGNTNDVLYVVDRVTGVATRVGNETEYGFSLNNVTTLAWDGVYLYGSDPGAQRLFILGRRRLSVESWAEDGNTDRLPIDKLPLDTARKTTGVLNIPTTATEIRLGIENRSTTPDGIRPDGAFGTGGDATVYFIDYRDLMRRAIIISGGTIDFNIRLAELSSIADEGARDDFLRAHEFELFNQKTSGNLTFNLAGGIADVRPTPAEGGATVEPGYAANVSFWAHGTSRYALAVNSFKPPVSDSEIDSRIATYARIAPTGTIPNSQIPASITRDTELTAGLATKANIASPTFTGTVTVPTPTADAHAATKKYVDDNIMAVTPHRGAYANNTAYDIGDVVTHNGGLYYVIAGVAGDNTDAPDANSSFERLDVESRTDTEINTLADVRIQDGVSDWAETGNTKDIIPQEKLAGAVATDLGNYILNGDYIVADYTPTDYSNGPVEAQIIFNNAIISNATELKIYPTSTVIDLQLLDKALKVGNTLTIINVDASKTWIGQISSIDSSDSNIRVVTFDDFGTKDVFTTFDLLTVSITGEWEAKINDKLIDRYTDSEKTKLAGVEAGATADQTSGEIKTAYESNANTNAYTDSEKTKLAGIYPGAEVNVNADWNVISGDAAILNKPTIPGNAEIDARVQAGVFDWAENGNTERIPPSKIPPVQTERSGFDGGTLRSVDFSIQGGLEPLEDPKIQYKHDYSEDIRQIHSLNFAYQGKLIIGSTAYNSSALQKILVFDAKTLELISSLNESGAGSFSGSGTIWDESRKRLYYPVSDSDSRLTAINVYDVTEAGVITKNDTLSTNAFTYPGYDLSFNLTGPALDWNGETIVYVIETLILFFDIDNNGQIQYRNAVDIGELPSQNVATLESTRNSAGTGDANPDTFTADIVMLANILRVRDATGTVYTGRHDDAVNWDYQFARNGQFSWNDAAGASVPAAGATYYIDYRPDANADYIFAATISAPSAISATGLHAVRFIGKNKLVATLNNSSVPVVIGNISKDIDTNVYTFNHEYHYLNIDFPDIDDAATGFVSLTDDIGIFGDNILIGRETLSNVNNLFSIIKYGQIRNRLENFTSITPEFTTSFSPGSISSFVATADSKFFYAFANDASKSLIFRIDPEELRGYTASFNIPQINELDHFEGYWCFSSWRSPLPNADRAGLGTFTTLKWEPWKTRIGESESEFYGSGETDTAIESAVENFAKTAETSRIPEDRLNLRDGQLVFEPELGSYTFDDGTGTFAEDEWRRSIGGENNIIQIRFSDTALRSRLITSVAGGNPIRLNGSIFNGSAVIDDTAGAGTATITLTTPLPTSFNNNVLAVRLASQLASKAFISDEIARSSMGSSPASFDRSPKVAVFYQYFSETDGTGPAFNGTYNTDSGWTNLGSWTATVPSVQPSSSVLWSCVVSAHWVLDTITNTNIWRTNSPLRQPVIEAFNHRWSPNTDNTQISYNYRQGTDKYQSIRGPSGVWGPWVRIDGQVLWHQLFTITNSFEVVRNVDVSPQFNLDDWSEIQVRLVTYGIAGHRHQAFSFTPIPTSSIGALTNYNTALLSSDTTLSRMEGHDSKINIVCGGGRPNGYNNIYLGWDNGPTTWNQYEGIEIAFGLRRPDSESATSRNVGGLSFRPRGGTWTQNATIEIYGR